MTKMKPNPCYMEALKGLQFNLEKLNLVLPHLILSQIFFDSYFTNTTVAESNSTQLFNLLSTAFYAGILNATDDFGRIGNEAFIYELLKQTTSQITSGSTIHLFTNSSFLESGMSFTLTEELTHSLSKVAIETFSVGNNDELDYNKISESIAFGSSMGVKTKRYLQLLVISIITLLTLVNYFPSHLLMGHLRDL